MASLIRSLFGANDEQMMLRVKSHDDSDAFARLVTRWERPIQRLCARMTGDIHGAEDLAQTVFVRVFARRRDWEPTARFSTFLWRIALNLCHDQLRRSRRRGECSLEALDEDSAGGLELVSDDEPAPDEQADTRERGELVRGALLKLAPHYREVVVLRHYEGMKFHEIGRVLDIPEGTAKSRMSEALTQLSRFLKNINDDTLCKQKTNMPEALTL
jgi:RNA polymerase sigma-70 factor (ECF subfamily)